jgi:hypothetical protein
MEFKLLAEPRGSRLTDAEERLEEECELERPSCPTTERRLELEDEEALLDDRWEGILNTKP